MKRQPPEGARAGILADQLRAECFTVGLQRAELQQLLCRRVVAQGHNAPQSALHKKKEAQKGLSCSYQRR